MSSSRRLIVVPRWGGRPDTAWYQWARNELLERAEPPFSEIEVLDMPDPDLPVVDAWVERLAAALGRPPATPGSTYLAGHSVGCQALLRYLATVPAGTRFGGALLVAAWWSVDEPWDSIRPWIERPFDVERARAACARFSVLLSDNDPFTADWKESAGQFSTRLGADVRVERGAEHFNRPQELAALEALEALAGA